MTSAFKHLRNLSVIWLIRPYTRRELPGWGKLYAMFVGGYKHNDKWKGYQNRWVIGKLHGFYIPIALGSWSNREAYFLERYFDVCTQLAMKALVSTGETIIDVGANEGMITLMAASVVGRTGKVIAFEPNPGPREILQQALDHNDIGWVDVRPVGLSDQPATLPLTVPAINSGEGSFGAPQYESTDLSVVHAEVAVGDQQLADVTPRLIKIDVEGFELHVLKGLNATIARHRPIIVLEMVTRHLLNAGTSAREVYEYMKSLGYDGWILQQTGRGSRLRVALKPIMLTDDLWDDSLWMHRADALLADLDRRLAGVSMKRG